MVNAIVLATVKRNSINDLDCDPDLFMRIVKMGFNQRRKTLRNALKGAGNFPVNTTDALFDRRAETLSVADFVTLTKMYQSH